MATWNVTTSIQILDARFVAPYGEAKCATHVREALQAGGLQFSPPHSGEAKDYGPSLTMAGFRDLSQLTTGWKQGDTVVFQAFGTHVHGHVAIYDGHNWLSDFKQPSIFPKHNYVGATFSVYRLGN